MQSVNVRGSEDVVYLFHSPCVAAGAREEARFPCASSPPSALTASNYSGYSVWAPARFSPLGTYACQVEEESVRRQADQKQIRGLENLAAAAVNESVLLNPALDAQRVFKWEIQNALPWCILKQLIKKNVKLRCCSLFFLFAWSFKLTVNMGMEPPRVEHMAENSHSSDFFSVLGVYEVLLPSPWFIIWNLVRVQFSRGRCLARQISFQHQ